MDYSNALCAICNAPADGGNCDVDVSVRCACRACRLTRCKAAGMRESDVQPKRDPTGSQKNRRAPQRRRGSAAASLLLVPKRETLPIFDNNNTDGENGYQTIHSPSTSSFPPSAESGIFDENGAAVQFVKKLEIREQQTEFERLVNDYSEHLRCMNRLLTPIEHFLTEQ
uniref:Nuclear receptor domain-containing protein n=1 Tax=Meloidogyne javanica TaxID=6303 RepID=A0A915M6N3_MELJA